LSERRNRIASEEHDLPAKMAAAAATCREAITALHDLQMDDSRRQTARRLGKAWKKQRRKALSALVECHDNAHAEAFHELRKSGQTYWMHLALLADIWPSAMRVKQEEAKRLVDLLGHEHDLSVLTQLVNETPEIFGDSETLALILGAIITRQQSLRQEALPIAHQVFSDAAEVEAELVRLLWEWAARARPKQRRAAAWETRQATTKETAST
jgi:hypothetical protein